MDIFHSSYYNQSTYDTLRTAFPSARESHIPINLLVLTCDPSKIIPCRRKEKTVKCPPS